MPNRAMLAKNTVYYSVYISPTAELSGSPQRQKKKHIDKPNRSSETQVLDQEIKLQLRLSRVWVSRRNSSLSLSPNVPIPFSHRIDFHSSPTEPPFKCLFLSELSLTTAASKRNEWFLNLWFSSNVRVFLFDHVLQSYCGNLFTWPSSQAPRVDCFIPFFISSAWLSAQHWEVFSALFWSRVFWHWNQSTWLHSLRTAQTCLGVGVSAGLRLPSANSAFLSPRGTSWQGCVSLEGGFLWICTKMLYRLALFAIGRPNQPL